MRAGRPGRRPRTAPVVRAVGVVAWLLATACSEAPPAAKPSSVPVLVADAELGPVVVSVALPGELRNPGEAVLSAEVAATVSDAPARAGQAVKRGDLIVALDDRAQRIALRQAEARLQQAQAQEAVRGAALERVRVTTSRVVDVATRDAAAISARDVEDARLALTEAEAAARAAAADTALRAAEVEAAELELARTRVRAPVDGVVARQDARVGQRAAIGAELARVAFDGALEGLFDAGEAQASRIAVGAPVEVAVPSRDEAVWTGVVAGVVPAADGAARNQRVRVALDPPPTGWVPGLAARARVEVVRLAEALTVPRDALTQGAVYVVRTALPMGARGPSGSANREAKAVKVPVGVLHDAGERLVVEGALAAGDHVVVRGNEALSDGAAVTVIGGAADATHGATTQGSGAVLGAR